MKSTKITIIVLTLAVIAAFTGLYLGSRYKAHAPSLVFAMVAGVTGALIRAWLTFQVDEEGKKARIPITSLDVCLDCALGAVLATVAYLLFSSAVISGELFPKFTDYPALDSNGEAITQETGWTKFANKGLKGSVDWGKMMLWSVLVTMRVDVFRSLVRKMFPDKEQTSS